METGERLNGIQEVSGSIPLISTKRLAFIRQVSFFAKKGGVRVYASLLVKLFSMYRVLEQGSGRISFAKRQRDMVCRCLVE